MGGGVCEIFGAASAKALQGLCDEIGECPVGKANKQMIFILQAKTNCYINPLALAVAKGDESIAFLLILFWHLWLPERAIIANRNFGK